MFLRSYRIDYCWYDDVYNNVTILYIYMYYITSTNILFTDGIKTLYIILYCIVTPTIILMYCIIVIYYFIWKQHFLRNNRSYCSLVCSTMVYTNITQKRILNYCKPRIHFYNTFYYYTCPLLRVKCRIQLIHIL